MIKLLNFTGLIEQSLARLPRLLLLAIVALAPVHSMAQNNMTIAQSASTSLTQSTDRLIVRYRENAVEIYAGLSNSTKTDKLSALLGTSIFYLRSMSGDRTDVYRLSAKRPIAEVEALAQTLKAHPDIEYAHPDRISFTQLIPSDPQYINQWALGNGIAGLNLAPAWDITTGDPKLVIGLLDTGLLPHADLDQSRILPGYDFVGDLTRSNDSNGRDSNATDPGDWTSTLEAALGGALEGCPVKNSSWHGTAMAGAIMATPNNANGITGINWQSKLLPVRVAGKCGAYASDIIDGLRWAVGIPVNGNTNPNPAKVINLSLATQGQCDIAYQSAINEVINLGATLVVAAGNSSQNTGLYSPASCNNVIVVGAVDSNGGLPSYANTGTEITVSAPGGNAVSGVLALSDSGLTTPLNDSIIKQVQGTSIATANVTGIVSLMLSANPKLKPTDVKSLLKAATRNFQTAPATGAPCATNACGAGMLDGEMAVKVALPFLSTKPMSSTGWSGQFLLKDDGTVWQGGAQVLGLSGVTALSAGKQVLALRSDGTVWAWGNNQYGQLGDASTTDKTTPVQVQGISGVMAVAAGLSHSLALKSDGTIWAWGDNQYGQLGYSQLGDGTTQNYWVPVKVDGLTNAVSITAGSTFSVAAMRDGSVWQWGMMNGLAATTAWNNPDPNINQIVSVSAGADHVLALRSDGKVWSWGSNAFGQMGDGTTSGTGPVAVMNLSGVEQIAGGYQFSVALKADGSVWVWGQNADGQLGNGATGGYSAVPVQALGLASIITVGAGNQAHSVAAIRTDGSVFQWGRYSTNLPQAVSGFSAGSFDQANFQPKVEQALGALVESAPWQAIGTANGSAILIVGGEYRVDGGSYTGNPGTINAGQAVTVRLTTSASYGQPTTATLTVGGTQRSFTATTQILDTTPNPFNFQTQANAATNSWISSDTVTVQGITGPAPISITGGEYRINAGAFTSATGAINPGDTVTVREMSGVANQIVRATLTIGNVQAVFDVISAPPAGFSTKPMSSTGWSGQFLLKDDGTVWQGGAQVLGLSGVTALSAGKQVLALRSDGTVWAWGNNQYGQLGDASTTDKTTPVQVQGISGVMAVAAGLSHSLALKSDGTIWAWGDNQYGQLGYSQLGDGTTQNYWVPVKVDGLTNAVSITAGSTFSVAAMRDGSVWQWGMMNGLAATTAWNNPDPNINQIVSVSAGADHVLALRSDGKVWSWGSNAFGQMGDGTTSGTGPVAVMNLSGVEQIAGGYQFSVALKADGSVWVWGQNADGQLGNGATGGYSAVPVQALGLASIITVGAGNQAHSVAAIRTDGSVFQWGGGTNLPQPIAGLNALRPDITPESFTLPPLLGQPRSAWINSVPITVRGMTAVTPISITGGQYSINGAAFTSAPGIIQSGDLLVVQVQSSSNYDGLSSATVTVGTYTTTFKVVAQDDPVATPVTAGLAVGDSHSAVLRPDGGVLTFGYNGNGSLGDGGYLSHSTPGLAAGVSSAKKIAAGKYHTLAIKKDGSLLAWGWNAAGQLGDGTLENSRRDAITVNLSNVKDVAAGYAHTIALKTDGTVWAWGLNVNGQLGDGQGGPGGSVRFSNTPIQVPGLSGIVAIAAGDRSSYAIDFNGNVTAWGDNTYGQLGIGSSAKRALSPTTVMLSGITRIAAGARHALAVRTDGSLWSWGENNNGQLGDGTRNSRSIPATVPGLLIGVTSIAAGDKHSLAIANGRIYAWGWNQNGQLGDSTTTDRLSPILVPNSTGVTTIAAGSRHTLALFSDNSIKLWGDNTYGQLGNRSGNYSPELLAQDQLRGDGKVVIIVASNTSSIGTTSTSSGSNSLTANDAADYISFGVQGVGVAGQRSFQLANNYLTSWTSLSIQASGPGFSQTNDCPSTLTADSRCTLNAFFTPPSPTEFIGAITISGNRGNGLETIKAISLNGFGSQANTPSIQLSAVSLDFGVVPVSTAGTTKRITLTNVGSGSLNIGTVSLAGSDYSQTNTCQNTTIAPSATCTMDVGFTPSQINTRSGTLTIAHNATGSSTTIPLTGQGQNTVPNAFTLIAGWNLIGNSNDATISVSSLFGDATKITTVWKWTPGIIARWAFYTPSQSDGGAAYAQSKGYDALSVINAGEGFWVNVKDPNGMSLALPTAGANITAASFTAGTTTIGWNLLAIGETKTPREFTNSVGWGNPPATGELVASGNVTTLWAWDATSMNWYFYAASLDAQGGTKLMDYITTKGYLDFANTGKSLGVGIGFWVNKP